ncbi:methylenetetrahydrofolate reductase [Pseudahrensia aquimaris]|uniref:Methylenetetrahydrofolate reductase n=1 Tax=Pseudahrensia aquimaris TaxID=744461 RepID=A0ABW3FIU4_9HYPH
MSSPVLFPKARVSLEYFPPKSISAERALMTAAHALARFKPAYQTVTFGAGGSDVSDSLDWPSRLQNLNEVPTAAHLSLSRFQGRDAVLSHADHLWQRGVRRLVVIRGDGDGVLVGFQSVAHAVRVLKGLHPFDISISAYPEVHPLAGSDASDLDVLLAKQEAGADWAITQFFFDNEDFYAFRDRAERAGFYREIVPGIMPITNFEKIARFAEQCGAAIPQTMRERFAACGDDRENHTILARELVSEQVADLARNGVEAIHVYTMNRIDLAADTIRAFQGESDAIAQSHHLKLAS